MDPGRRHGSYWGIVAAVVGLAGLAGLLWFYLEPGEPDVAGKQNLEQQNPQYRPGGPECDPQWLARISGRQAEGIRQACAEAAEEHRLKANDLVQQTRSADAAQYMLGFADSQTRSARVGVILGFFTLIAAGAAAYFAKRAAHETERTAVAAERTVRLANYTARRQLRAYVGVSKGQVALVSPDIPITGVIVSKNAGQTPAYECRVWYNVDVLENNTPLQLGEAKERTSGVSIQLPGMESMHPIFTRDPIRRDDLLFLQNDNAKVVIYGEITYKDIFRREHTTRFRMESGSYLNGTFTDLGFCEEGNDAT